MPRRKTIIKSGDHRLQPIRSSTISASILTNFLALQPRAQSAQLPTFLTTPAAFQAASAGRSTIIHYSARRPDKYIIMSSISESTSISTFLRSSLFLLNAPAKHSPWTATLLTLPSTPTIPTSPRKTIKVGKLHLKLIQKTANKATQTPRYQPTSTPTAKHGISSKAKSPACSSPSSSSYSSS